MYAVNASSYNLFSYKNGNAVPISDIANDPYAINVFCCRAQGKISDIDIQRLAIETGEHFTLDEVREMIEAADENGERPCLPSPPFWR